MLPLKGWMRPGWLAFGDDEVDGFGAGGFDVGAGGVKVGVVGNHVAGLEHDGEEDALGGASLVGGDDVGVAEDALHGVAEADIAAAAGITLIALLDGSPLIDGHGPGAGVGQQIDQHIIGREKKEIVVRKLKKTFAIGALGPVDGLDALDAERLNDRADGHGQPRGSGRTEHCSCARGVSAAK